MRKNVRRATQKLLILEDNNVIVNEYPKLSGIQGDKIVIYNDKKQLFDNSSRENNNKTIVHVL